MAGFAPLEGKESVVKQPTRLQQSTLAAIESSGKKERFKRGERVRIKLDWCPMVTGYQLKCFSYVRLIGTVMKATKEDRNRYLIDFKQTGQWFIHRAKGKVLGGGTKINRTTLAGEGFPSQMLERAKDENN